MRPPQASKESSGGDLPGIPFIVVWTSKSLGFSPKLMTGLPACGSHVPFRTASSIIRRARRLTTTERPTMTNEMASRSSNVAESGWSGRVTGGGLECCSRWTNQETCRGRDLTSGCLEVGASLEQMGKHRRSSRLPPLPGFPPPPPPPPPFPPPPPPPGKLEGSGLGRRPVVGVGSIEDIVRDDEGCPGLSVAMEVVDGGGLLSAQCSALNGNALNRAVYTGRRRIKVIDHDPPASCLYILCVDCLELGRALRPICGDESDVVLPVDPINLFPKSDHATTVASSSRSACNCSVHHALGLFDIRRHPSGCMDSQPKGPALPIPDDSRVSIERNKSSLPPKNSTISRLGVACLTMVVSLVVDIFPSQIGVSIPSCFSLSLLSPMRTALTGVKRGLLMISMPV